MGASWLRDGFHVMFPAECQVVPEPSRSRSNKRTSPMPLFARCQAMLAPTTPPPTTRHFMGACLGEGRRSRDLPSVERKPCIDQDHDLVDGGKPHALLCGDALHQSVYALDVGRAREEGPRSGGGSHQSLGGSRIFLERYEIGGI